MRGQRNDDMPESGGCATSISENWQDTYLQRPTLRHSMFDVSHSPHCTAHSSKGWTGI